MKEQKNYEERDTKKLRKRTILNKSLKNDMFQ